VASAEGKRTERFSEKSLNLENSLIKTYVSDNPRRVLFCNLVECRREKELNDFQRNSLDIEIKSDTMRIVQHLRRKV
jgi:hypothetical protein